MDRAPRPIADEARAIVKPFGADLDLERWAASLLAARERFERRREIACVLRDSPNHGSLASR